MPPIGKPRPDNAGYQQIVSQLESVLDRAAKAKPNPGRTDTVRRLNRTEYQNVIRDLQAYRDAVQQGTVVTRMARKGQMAGEEIEKLFVELLPQFAVNESTDNEKKEIING